jgi:hypothetical protein
VSRPCWIQTGPVGEAVDVADIGQQPRRPVGPMPVRSISVEPRSVTSAVRSSSAALIFLSIAAGAAG